MPKSKSDRDRVGPALELARDDPGDDLGVRTANSAVLQLRGSFKVGPGDSVEDVRRARELMGKKNA